MTKLYIQKFTRGLEKRLRIFNSNEYERQQLMKHQLVTADFDIKSWLKVLYKQYFFYLTKIICFARCSDFKMIPLNVMSGGSDMVSNG